MSLTESRDKLLSLFEGATVYEQYSPDVFGKMLYEAGVLLDYDSKFDGLAVRNALPDKCDGTDYKIVSLNKALQDERGTFSRHPGIVFWALSIHSKFLTPELYSVLLSKASKLREGTDEEEGDVDLLADLVDILDLQVVDQTALFKSFAEDYPGFFKVCGPQAQPYLLARTTEFNITIKAIEVESPLYTCKFQFTVTAGKVTVKISSQYSYLEEAVFELAKYLTNPTQVH